MTRSQIAGLGFGLRSVRVGIVKIVECRRGIARGGLVVIVPDRRRHLLTIKVATAMPVAG